MAEPLFALHPTSAGDMLNRAVRLYRRHLRRILRIAFLPSACAFLICTGTESWDPATDLVYRLGLVVASPLCMFLSAILARWVLDPGAIAGMESSAAALALALRPESFGGGRS